jgi:hypothetical protein
MPVTTPDIKVDAVRRLGGTVELVGETYSETQTHAQVRILHQPGYWLQAGPQTAQVFCSMPLRENQATGMFDLSFLSAWLRAVHHARACLSTSHVCRHASLLQSRWRA